MLRDDVGEVGVR